jgi:hypothetical protein
MKLIYSEEIIELMRDYVDQLPERPRRHYAAIEARKLGYGGISYVSELLDIDPKTIRRGCNELSGLRETVSGSRQRKPGGGRKKKLQKGATFVNS